MIQTRNDPLKAIQKRAPKLDLLPRTYKDVWIACLSEFQNSAYSHRTFAKFANWYFNLQTWIKSADWYALGVALSLPWSTTATAIFITLWLLCILPTLNIAMVRRELTTFAGGLPVLLWLLAVVGMLWADVTWAERIDDLRGYHRLLAIPILLAQFRRSGGVFVLYGFVVSATCLLFLSFAYMLIPALAIHSRFYGVPVKDYIFQSEVFLICAFALIGAACDLWRVHMTWMALALGTLGALFLANIGLVMTSRTALMVAPFLAVLLGWRQLRLKGVIAAVLVGLTVAAALWAASPVLRMRTLLSANDFRAYFTSTDVTSTSLHIEFLRESMRIVESAPLIGHGTGSITEQFRRLTAGQPGVLGVATVNPHNQIFAVAVALGLVGAAVLLAMWAAHFILFRGGGITAWVGTVIVVQNVVSCLANSHLFDFSQGWLYVFGVGIAGGVALREADPA
jgi:O-antigen ligase